MILSRDLRWPTTDTSKLALHSKCKSNSERTMPDILPPSPATLSKGMAAHGITIGLAFPLFSVWYLEAVTTFCSCFSSEVWNGEGLLQQSLHLRCQATYYMPWVKAREHTRNVQGHELGILVNRTVLETTAGQKTILTWASVCCLWGEVP